MSSSPPPHHRLLPRWAAWPLKGLIAVLITAVCLALIFCETLYAAGARHLPDALPPTTWQADAALRRQFLLVEIGNTAPMPRMNPITVWRPLLETATAGESRPIRRTPSLPSLAARVVGLRMLAQPMSHLSRLLTEQALAIRISREWTTEQTIDTILAESHYAQDVRGFEAASQHFFQRPAGALRPQETLALIALLKGPSWYDPVCNRDRFEQRYARLAQEIGGTGPAWSSATALARLRVRACTRR